MKRIFLTFISLLMALLLCACMESPKPGSGDTPAAGIGDNNGTEATAEPEATAELGNTEEPAAERPEEDWLILTWNGERVTPCIRFLYGTSVAENEDGSLSAIEADGAAFFEGIKGAVGQTPEVGPDFELEIAEGCWLQQVKVYDPVSLEERAFDAAAQEILDIIHLGSPEDVIVEAIVTHTGNYYASLDESERMTYSYAFTVKGNEAYQTGEEPGGETSGDPAEECAAFASLEELDAALEAGELGLEGYYIPTALPGETRFERVSVTPDAVEITYHIEPEWDYEEGDPTSVVLIWHRGAGADEAEELAREEGGGKVVEREGVWIVRSNELQRHAYWATERGDVLEIVYPFCYPEDSDAVAFAHAEWIPAE